MDRRAFLSAFIGASIAISGVGLFGAATDNFSTFATGLDSPARHAALVTPDDSNDLTYACRAFRVTTAGDVKVTTVGGETVTLAGLLAGERVDLCVVRIFSTGTTASGISVYW